MRFLPEAYKQAALILLPQFYLLEAAGIFEQNIMF
jgi:hypothetical protein